MGPELSLAEVLKDPAVPAPGQQTTGTMSLPMALSDGSCPSLWAPGYQEYATTGHQS